MQALIFTIAGFLAFSAIIIFSEAGLSKHGDIITSLTGMGRAGFGLILKSAVTSFLSFIECGCPVITAILPISILYRCLSKRFVLALDAILLIVLYNH